MRVQTEEWRRFTPGVRMYKGKKTLFWNGDPLLLVVFRDGEDIETVPFPEIISKEFLIYNEAERNSWEVILILPGVEIVPFGIFHSCTNVTTVIMADTVLRVEDNAFHHCESLVFIKLSRNLEYIGRFAFRNCKSLISIFIPPSCREIKDWAFGDCEKLIVFKVSQQTQLGERVISSTELLEVSPFQTDFVWDYEELDVLTQEINHWIKNINQAEEFALHRACSSFNPLLDIILAIVKRQGLRSLKMKNGIGVTPLQYLDANPYTDIKEKTILKQYILDMMGALVL